MYNIYIIYRCKVNHRIIWIIHMGYNRCAIRNSITDRIRIVYNNSYMSC